MTLVSSTCSKGIFPHSRLYQFVRFKCYVHMVFPQYRHSHFYLYVILFTVFSISSDPLKAATKCLSERWPCHIWPVGRMKFASLEANLDGIWGLLDPILLFPLPLSGRSLDMTEILLTWALSLNLINSTFIIVFMLGISSMLEEHSGSVVKCLTWDRRVTSSIK